MEEWDVFFWIGNGLLIILHIGYKLLRKMQGFSVLFVITALIAVFGIYKTSDLTLEKNNSSGIWLVAPFLFVVCFGIFRLIFIKIFKNEPLMTRPYMISWDDGEYRRLHFGDAIFTILTYMTPILSLVYFSF